MKETKAEKVQVGLGPLVAALAALMFAFGAIVAYVQGGDANPIVVLLGALAVGAGLQAVLRRIIRPIRDANRVLAFRGDATAMLAFQAAVRYLGDVTEYVGHAARGDYAVHVKNLKATYEQVTGSKE